MSKRQTSSRKAFTLVEVILAVVVLGVLALVLGNSFSDATEESKWKVKLHNAAQITERGRLADELGFHWYGGVRSEVTGVMPRHCFIGTTTS